MNIHIASNSVESWTLFNVERQLKESEANFCYLPIFHMLLSDLTLG